MFGKLCSLIGVIHVPALPGADSWQGSMEHLLDVSLKDARAYVDGGVDALIVENMHDVPYLLGNVEPESTAAMAVVAKAVKVATGLPLGIQLLAGANLESLAVALASGADFIRSEGFVFAHVGDEGLHQSCAATLIRRRAQLKANHIKIFVDIKKKHSSHAITSDITLEETAHAAEFFKADGMIVTGMRTGDAPSLAEIVHVKAAVKTPVMVGSGITDSNIASFAMSADSLIVGSFAKYDGIWQNAVDKSRVKVLADSLQSVNHERAVAAKTSAI
ncbi:MAG: BtpA/SgcQ family protein [Candidatus Obscuribacter sp.]|jgi:membrane complex biogenesis BtpA family protein|nr:BtpA/SgcQ family protein [Candidatus Obscuribacter sp.]MBP6351793.1 BtpA/SgcQ family protein [Candidatus Obscuribacter sp.]